MFQNLDVISQIVIDAISNYLGEEGVKVTRYSLLEEEYGLDSTELVCVAVELERRLGVELKGIRFGRLKTPDDVTVAIIDLMKTLSSPKSELAKA